LLITHETIQFNVESDHWLDTATFSSKVEQRDLPVLEEAVSLYRGDFLAGFQLKDSIAFDDWHLLTRERLQRQASAALRRLADAYQKQGEYERASEFAWRQVEMEPWYEEGHQQLMRLLALSGQRSAALAQYETCRHQLALELAIEPSPETTRLYEQIRDGELITPEATPFLDLPPTPGTPPYKGLQYFDETDAELFFGRETLITKLVAQLDPVSDRRFLAVVGASGSGKSSIVRAGLIPALQRGEAIAEDRFPAAGSPSWPVHILTPSAHPLQALAVSLTRDAGTLSATTALIDDMARDPRSLHLHVCRILPPSANYLLLVVDQFEELFTQCRGRVEQQAFVDNLMTAVAMNGPAIVVITLRADFYAHCAEYVTLREALEQHQVYIGSMSEEELRRVVTEPAKQGGWELEPGLVDFMLGEVVDEPGALPLLSHALLETWKHRRGRMLTLAGYNESGGVGGSIARTAERVLQRLEPAQQNIARNIFLRLTELGESTQETRRRAKLSELVREPEEAAAVEQVLKRLVDARLVITSEESVEVAHEALIREWPTLRGWLEQDLEGLRIHRHLTDAAQEWKRLERDPGELYRGARLAVASEWSTTHDMVLNPLEREFLAASQKLVQRQEAEQEAQRQRELKAAQKATEAEHQRAEEQARSARRLRRGALLLAGISLVAVLMAVFAFAAQATARREAAVNRSLVLAGQANEANEAGEVDLALALALEAVAINEPPLDAVSKLAKVANGMGTRSIFTGHNGAVQAGAFSPDGRQAISGGCVQADDAGICHSGELILWDLAAEKETARWPGHDAWVSVLAWSPSSQEILSGGGDGSLVLWDAVNQEILAQWTAHDAAINALAISPDGTQAAAASDDGTLTLLNLANRKITHHLEGHSGPILDIAFSPDGRQLVSGSADTTMILWNVSTEDPTLTFTGHASSIQGVAFLPDGQRILSVSSDLSYRLWDAASSSELQRRESGGRPSGMTLSPDGRTVLSRVDHTIETWDLVQWNTPHRRLLGHVGKIMDVAISSDGSLALSTGDDGTVRIWNLHGEGDLQLNNIGFSATGVAVAPDGNALAIGVWGDDSMIWDLAKGQPTLDLSGGIGAVAPGSVAYSPDGHWVVAGSGDYDHDTEAGSLLVWEAATGEIHCDLQGHDRRLRTVAFSPDSRYVLSGSQGADEMGTIVLWDVNDCHLVRRFATEQDTTGIDFSDDGRYAVTASAFSANVTLWNVATGQAVQVFSLPGDVLLDTAFGPDDETVLAATLSGLIIQWDRETDQEIRRFTGHDGGVWSVSLSPDEQKLISSDDTGTIILWDMVTGAELRRHNAHNTLSFQAAFSPDGQTVYSVSVDKTLVVWQVGDPSLPALLSWIEGNRYERQLTCAERERYDVSPLCD
jgi:WD40 repeat protein